MTKKGTKEYQNFTKTAEITTLIDHTIIENVKKELSLRFLIRWISLAAVKPLKLIRGNCRSCRIGGFFSNVIPVDHVAIKVVPKLPQGMIGAFVWKCFSTKWCTAGHIMSQRHYFKPTKVLITASLFI